MIKQIRKKIQEIHIWFSRSFSRKIMSVLLICISFIIIFLSLAYYCSTIRLLQDEYIDSNEQLLAEINQSIGRYYEQLNETTQSLYNDSSFIDNLRFHAEDYTTADYNERVIKNILYSDDAIQYIYFYDPYTQNLYSYARGNMSYAPYPDLEQEDWYQQTVNDDHYFYISPLHTFRNYNHFGSLKNTTVFSVNRALRYYVTGEIIGVLSINYDTSYLEKICQNLYGTDGYIAILDQDLSPRFNTYPGGKIVNQIKDNIRSSHGTHGFYKYSLAGEQRILLWDKQEETYLLKDIPLEELTQNARIVLQITLVISGIIFFLSVSIAFYFSRSATRKLSRLTQDIAEFGEGNLTIDARDYGIDEIGLLASTFNHMTEKINELINLEYKAKVLRKNAELQALQAQVKPHFINNVLQALGTLGLKKGAKDVYFMANALAKTLRYSLKTTTELVPLSREIENMNDYLYIQKILWNNRLTVSMEIDERLSDFPVPVFILQPLVENSIKHGLDDQEEGLIRIRIHSLDSSISIQVMDNGRGIPTASLDMLNQWLNDDAGSAADEHIGLRNIIGRMRLIYGEQASFTISCPPEGGTCIQIILPREDSSDV